MPDEALPLERWGNFYVITSTAAAALIGLLFVLITLAAQGSHDVVGVVGLLYTASLVVSRGGRKPRYLEASDVVMYVVFPAAAYALLIVGGVVLGHAPQQGLTLAAASMLALITLAVRNSWSIAVAVVSSPGQDR
jgi:hypothetical protein